MDYPINNSRIEERQQINVANRKAFLISSLLFLLLFICLFFIHRQPPPMAQILGVAEMEVNIGNVDNALGDNQPLMPDMPNNTATNIESTPQANDPITQENNINTEDKGEVEMPIKPTPKKPITKQKSIAPKSTPTNKSKVATPQSASPAISSPPTPAPAPTPTPKAIMGALTNNNMNGGNQADSYNKGGNQGNTQGDGDMGMLGGSQNGVNAPVSFNIVKGLSNRKIVYVPQYNDDFNKGGTVRIRVSFDNNGSATTASFYLPGSNTSDKTLINLALKRAKAIKLNQDVSAPIEQEAIFEFVFKIR